MNTPTKPVLITLTSPTAAGKSHLINYIRAAGHPCLISTTTRSPRVGEVEGNEYYFISEEESKKLEAEDGFAELAIYRGVRYGVTKEEFDNKLNRGYAFLIVEPTGLEHYTKYAIDSGAAWLKYYVHTDFDTRYNRFEKRTLQDVKQSLEKSNEAAASTVKTALDRLRAMTTVEKTWFSMHNWDRVLFGTSHPQVNLDIILRDIKRINTNQ